VGVARGALQPRTDTLGADRNRSVAARLARADSLVERVRSVIPRQRAEAATSHGTGALMGSMRFRRQEICVQRPPKRACSVDIDGGRRGGTGGNLWRLGLFGRLVIPLRSRRCVGEQSGCCAVSADTSRVAIGTAAQSPQQKIFPNLLKHDFRQNISWIAEAKWLGKHRR